MQFKNQQPNKQLCLTPFFIGLCLFFLSNTLSAQLTYAWGGGTSTDWATPANWSVAGVTATAIPTAADIVVISSGTPIISSGSQFASKVTVSNGATLTISGGSLTVAATVSSVEVVAINGGSIVNNGALNITGSTTINGIKFADGTPTSSNSSYSGSGTLSINTSSASPAGTGTGIAVNFNNTSANIATFNVTSSATTITLGAAKTALNVALGAKAVVDGTGFALSTGDFRLIAQSGASLEIKPSVTLSCTGTATSSVAVSVLPSSTAIASLTNGGTLNISGIYFAAIRLQSTSSATCSFNNQGTVNANISSNGAAATFYIPAGTSASPYSVTNSGTMSLTNTNTSASRNAFLIDALGSTSFSNTGTITAVGLSYFGISAATTLTNSGTINSDFTIGNAAFTGNLTNQSSGIINFTGAANAISSAISCVLNNQGTINTNTGLLKAVNISSPLSSITNTGTLSPGGNSGKSLMTFTNATAGTLMLGGILKMQVAGKLSTDAGTLFDKVTVSGASVNLNLTNMALDVSIGFTPNPAGDAVNIISLTSLTPGAITGPFANVTGLPTGWAVVYSATGVDLVYASTIPVELVSFKATPLSNLNQLTWLTASEINSKGFDIQRKTPTGAWTSLGFVASQGKGATYSFDDTNPLSISYYRLRQIDNDGKEKLSKVVSVATGKNTTARFYPSVTKGNLTIEAANDATFSVFITDLAGRTVLSKSVTGTEILDVSHLSSGIYILSLTNANTYTASKFIKN